MTKDYGLEINNSVVVKMASVATLEIDGVAGLFSKNGGLVQLLTKSNAERAIYVTKENDSTEISIYISVKDGYDVREVAQNVQESVKSKLQTMTGNAIEKVNVIVADVQFKEENNK